MRVFIAHAEFIVERRATLRRLVGQLEVERADVVVLASKSKEHSSVWSDRLWAACAEAGGDAICLNDDVILPPSFMSSIYAMLKHADADIVSLHTNLPVAVSLAHAGQRFLRSYLVTGPGYLLRYGVARHLLRFARERITAKHRASTQEDNVLSYFSWSRREPAWATIPGLVQHDVSVASTCGYEEHPNRTNKVPYDLDVFRPNDTEPARITSEAFWKQENLPAMIECSWMPMESLASAEVQWNLGIEPGHCWSCRERKGEVGAPKTGLMLCAMCGVGLGGAAANVLIDWRTRVGKALKDKKAEEDAARSSKLIAPTPAPIPQDILTRRA